MASDAIPSRYFAVVPAAGVGKRMSADRPKQYLTLQGKTILEHTIERLLNVEKIECIVVVVSEHDDYWQDLTVLNDQRVNVAIGGAERSISVLNGLMHLKSQCDDNDWILVHDVVRPCIEAGDVERLIETLASTDVGGILAIPMSDTVKQVDDEGKVQGTIDRNILWRAQTPQMFRYSLLLNALEQGIDQGESITDEASAVEMAGFSLAVVAGARSNIKVTRPEDLALAEFFLTMQKNTKIKETD